MFDFGGSKEEKKEELLPVDIQYDKCKEWLQNRNFLSTDWPTALKTIRSWCKKALQDLPDHESVKQVVDSVEGEQLDYFKCQEMLKVVEEVEPKSTGLFGFGGSKRVKMWKYIIKLYLSGYVYLAEVATTMVKNVKYEIPALRKQMSKFHKLIEELGKKEEDWKKAVADYTKMYQKECERLKIKGENIKEEIPALVKELPEWYKKIEDVTRTDDVKKVIDFYFIFVKFVHGKEDKSSLPMLQYMLEKGNTSIFDWKKSQGQELPDVDMEEVEKARKQKQEQKSEQTTKKVEIDWSGLVEMEKEQASIEVSKEEPIDIKWDFEVSEEGAKDDNKKETIDSGINSTDISGGFSMDLADDDLQESNKPALEIDWGDDTSKPQTPSPVEIVLNMMEETILENDETRYEFVNDVMELHDFLISRMREKSQESENILGQTNSVPTELLNENLDDLKKYHKTIQGILEVLNDPRFRELILIKSSKKYTERLTNSLKQRTAFIDQLNAKIEEIDPKRKETQKEMKKLKPEIEKLIKQTKELQKFLEAEISKLLNGRKVNIFGEINNLHL